LKRGIEIPSFASLASILIEKHCELNANFDHFRNAILPNFQYFKTINTYHKTELDILSTAVSSFFSWVGSSSGSSSSSFGSMFA